MTKPFIWSLRLTIPRAQGRYFCHRSFNLRSWIAAEWTSTRFVYLRVITRALCLEAHRVGAFRRRETRVGPDVAIPAMMLVVMLTLVCGLPNRVDLHRVGSELMFVARGWMVTIDNYADLLGTDFAGPI